MLASISTRNCNSAIQAALAFVCGLVGSAAIAQDSAPAPLSPAPVIPAQVTDQLPPRREFPPLPVNDLRSRLRLPDSEAPTASNPAAAASIVSADQGTPSGNATGSFLTPKSNQPAQPATNELNSTSQPTIPPAAALAAPQLPPQRAFNAPVPLQSTPSRSRPVEIISEPLFQDSAVRPASGELPGRSAADAQAGLSPRSNPTAIAQQRLGRYSLSQTPGALPGQPLKLEDALQSAPPDRRRQIVRQYWVTYGAWASFLNCSDQVERLGAIGRSTDPVQSQVLETNRMQAEDERLSAEVRLQQAQSELQRLLPSAGSDLLPLPSDQPLVQSYETHSDWYVANGQLPGNLRTIARSLPLQLKLIGQRAMTAEAAAQNAARGTQAYAAAQTDLPALLAVVQQSQTCQQAFLQSVLDYNQWIADYSLTIAPPNQLPGAIAGMLVAPRNMLDAETRSVLADAVARPADRWAGTPVQTRSIKAAPAPVDALPTQPIERVSGLEPVRPMSPAVVPAAVPSAGPPVSAPPTAASFAPPPSTGFSPGIPPAGNSNPASSSGNSTGSFSPALKIPSFDPPATQPPAPPAGGNQFKLGG